MSNNGENRPRGRIIYYNDISNDAASSGSGKRSTERRPEDRRNDRQSSSGQAHQRHHRAPANDTNAKYVRTGIIYSNDGEQGYGREERKKTPPRHTPTSQPTENPRTRRHKQANKPQRTDMPVDNRIDYWKNDDIKKADRSRSGEYKRLESAYSKKTSSKAEKHSRSDDERRRVYVENEKQLKERKKEQQKRLGELIKRAVFITARSIVIGIGITALLYIFFHVWKVEVIGNEVVEAADIVKLSGIKKAHVAMLVNESDIEKRLSSDPRISAEVVKVFPNKIRIEVTERIGTAYIESYGKFAVIDNTGSVLRITDNAEDGLIKISGMGSLTVDVGQKLGEVNDVAANIIMTVINAISDSGLKGNVLEIDCSNIFRMELKLSNGCEAVIGDERNLDKKFDMIIKVIEREKINNKGAGTVNVVNPEKPLYKEFD